MPLQNRVNPFGNILAVPEFGTCMGNRGVLHNKKRQVTRPYRSLERWIICKLGFKGRERKVMSSGYTELFFLDEVTALAAGHRPCKECSKPRYDEFADYWAKGNPDLLGDKKLTAGLLDHFLDQERLDRQTGQKRTYAAHLNDLPFGTFVTLEPGPQAQPYLVLGDSLWPWNFGGYGKPVERPNGIEVTVLTPPSAVRALRAGYQPKIHPEPY